MTDTIAREPGLIICDIIQHEMQLAPSQVMIYNQRFPLPTAETALQITVGAIGPGRTIATSRYADPAAASGMAEVQEMVISELYQIDIMSADLTARTRRMELLMALTSGYAVQACTASSIMIARIPQNFVDASEIDGAARLNRYTITIAVQSRHTVTADVPYYDDIQNPPSVWVDTKPPED